MSNQMPEFYRTPMTAQQLMEHIVRAKAEHRKELAKLPYAEKLASIDRMRERSRLFRNSRIVKRQE